MVVRLTRSSGLSSGGQSGKSLVSASGRGTDSTVRDHRSRREAGHDGRRAPLQERARTRDGRQRPCGRWKAGCGPRRDGLAGDPPPQRGGEHKQHQRLQLLLDAGGHLRHAHGVRRWAAAVGGEAVEHRPQCTTSSPGRFPAVSPSSWQHPPPHRRSRPGGVAPPRGFVTDP